MGAPFLVASLARRAATGYVQKVPSQAYERTWNPLLQDVQNLMTLHPSQQGSPGRPAGDTGPLLRSAVVLLHTAWENYVEQLAIEAVDFVLASVTEHTALPDAQRERLSTLKNPWALAGDGWRTEARSVVENEAARLNTPNIANTESLLNLAGYPNAMHEIKWRRTSNIKVRTEVDRFVHEIRGEIVHKGSTPGPLHKAGVEAWIQFFGAVVSRLDVNTAAVLADDVDATPWD